MTESKMPLSSKKTNKSALKNNDIKKAPPSSKFSKLSVLAILIAVSAPAGHYYWQQLQNQQIAQTLTNKISEKNSATLNNYQTQMQQALTKQQQSFDQQLQQVSTKIAEFDTSVTQLEQSIKQRQPSDWLLHEAEYLIRIAARTLWLEHDTNAAIGLLKDADDRLSQLNNPNFLPVREVIHQDINALQLLPKLQTDEIILTLMAMNKQVDQLPLNIAFLGKAKRNKADVGLSSDINDWQSNLTKIWQQFLDDFIRVRQRDGTVEPLISPDQQANLKQNLSLKIQLALWAASERKGDVYQKSLDDIKEWLNEFFDIKNIANQHVIQTLNDLKQKQVDYDYPNDLSALTAIRATLKKQQVKPLTLTKKELNDVNTLTQQNNDSNNDSNNEGKL